MKNTSSPLIVFDMDGTLIDSLPDINRSCQTLLQSYRLPSVTTDFIRSTLGDGIHATVERVLNHVGKAAASIDRKEAVQRFIADYTPHAADISKPFDGALTCLETFKKEGWKIALCTNKLTKAATNILDKLNLTAFFDAVGGGDRFANKKPDPSHLLGIINLLSSDPLKTVIVGDHLNDILVAKNAHIAGSIFAQWGYGKPEMGIDATRQAQSIRQIPSIAQEIIDQ